MALKDEFADDVDLAKYLEVSKAKLQTYFKQNYSCPSLQANSSLSTPSLAGPSLSSVVSTSMSSISSPSGSPQKSLTARFQRKHTSPDELLEFWSLPQEDFEIIDPLQWWLGRRAQFPQLYRLARDIFSIPGMLLYYFFFNTNFFQDQPLLLNVSSLVGGILSPFAAPVLNQRLLEFLC